MPSVGSLISFSAGTVAVAADVNSNYTTLRNAVNTYALWVDVNRTVTATITFSTSPVFPAAVTFALGATITAGGLVVTAGNLTFGAATPKIIVGASGLLIRNAADDATLLSFSGSAVELSATTLTSGTIPDARFPATLPAASGVNLTALNATNIASGTIDTARLPATVTVTAVAATTYTVNGTMTVNGAILVPLIGSPAGRAAVNGDVYIDSANDRIVFVVGGVKHYAASDGTY